MRSRVLLWSAICFTLLAVVNLLVIFDLVIYPTAVDLRPERMWLTLVAVAVLLFGLHLARRGLGPMLYAFLGGAIVMGFAVAALMFLKFWRRTKGGPVSRLRRQLPAARR